MTAMPCRRRDRPDPMEYQRDHLGVKSWRLLQGKASHVVLAVHPRLMSRHLRGDAGSPQTEGEEARAADLEGRQ